mmetsp:Transcript_670/g.4367  ORF Transcript_670/g.4367 Transcript_670/m.4367 type:complete len:353 (-) Transcript_670:472-1530(-)|eukprot:CAMPEP_0183830100 /NCGR_PEP_ID=MMETSP0807_2-20130328/3826_1 /TAXON_ID=88271 /ORGANISM="Picocystis salinarum, Strain CCMP1897" /LENGTH=352 /DNA_ID=CAMNT_0026075443 /DNA_START=105 /DNA_END=1163 /DNA_ORIENTATION=+
MPELPEVEAARKRVHATCLGHVIAQVEVADDTKVYDNETPENVKKTICGRKIIGTHRKGKYFWLEFDQGPCLTFHLGMTGNISINGVPSHKYKGFKTDYEGWPPRFWKMDVLFDNGMKLAYTDPRRFGRIRINRDPVLEAPINKLGFDPLLDMPSLKRFAELLPDRRAPIKAVLLDQTFAAGIGNWVADEILYQSKIHPEQPCNSLSTTQVALMHTKIDEVISKACNWDADYEDFPHDWIFHHRWRKQAGAKVDGKAITFITCGGRTTAFVPSIQKKTSVTPRNSVKETNSAPKLKTEGKGNPNGGAPKAVKKRKAEKRKESPGMPVQNKSVSRAIHPRVTRSTSKAMAVAS